MIIVEYNKNWATLYAHLNKIQVSQGDWVQTGEQIATMGRSGRATGTHLHFELLKDKLPVNPMNFLSTSPQLARHSD